MGTASSDSRKYLEVSFYVPRDHSEAVCNFIIENFSAGLILDEDEKSDEVGVRFYIPPDDIVAVKEQLTAYLSQLENLSEFNQSRIHTQAVEELSWVETFRQSVKPIILEGVVIRPPWAEIEMPGAIDIVIEPKMAFGTGSHETTRLCLKAILKHFKRGQSFFDLGCGSGILSILAARMDGGNIKGVDIDTDAVENARENIEINGVADKIEIVHGSVESAESDPLYDFAAANLIITTIEELYDRLNSIVRPGGIILLSGLLVEDEARTRKLLDRDDIDHYDITRDGEWLAFVIGKK